MAVAGVSLLTLGAAPADEGAEIEQWDIFERDFRGRRGAFVRTPARAGNHGPVRVHNTFHFACADGTKLTVEALDTWNMTITPVQGRL